MKLQYHENLLYQTNSRDIFVKMTLDLRAALTCKLCLVSNKVGLPALLL